MEGRKSIPTSVRLFLSWIHAISSPLTTLQFITLSLYSALKSTQTVFIATSTRLPLVKIDSVFQRNNFLQIDDKNRLGAGISRTQSKRKSFYKGKSTRLYSVETDNLNRREHYPLRILKVKKKTIIDSLQT